MYRGCMLRRAVIVSAAAAAPSLMFYSSSASANGDTLGQVTESDLVTLPDGRKQWQLASTVKHPWEIVVETYYRSKRPHGAYTPYIDKIVLLETSGKAGADFGIERKHSTPPVVPSWLFVAIQLISGTESKMSFLEKLKVRRKDGELRGEFQMLSFGTYAECIDVTTFERHPDNKDWTLVKVQATLRLSSSLFGLSAFFESLMIRAYAKNVREGRADEDAYAMLVAEEMNSAEAGPLWIDTVPELTDPPSFYSPGV